MVLGDLMLSIQKRKPALPENGAGFTCKSMNKIPLIIILITPAAFRTQIPGLVFSCHSFPVRNCT